MKSWKASLDSNSFKYKPRHVLFYPPFPPRELELEELNSESLTSEAADKCIPVQYWGFLLLTKYSLLIYSRICLVLQTDQLFDNQIRETQQDLSKISCMKVAPPSEMPHSSSC